MGHIELLEARRLLASAGDLDLSFGSDGHGGVPLPGEFDEVSTILPAGSDEFFILGFGKIMKVDENATPLVGFGQDGVVDVPFLIYSGFLQADGKILAVAVEPPGDVGQITKVVRFNGDGSLDTTFANNGVFDPT